MYLKLCLILGVLVTTSCNKESIIESDTILSLQSPTTRTAGDGVYDVLGYGYDITNEYCGKNATKLRILDVNKNPETVPLGRYFNGLDHYYETYMANYTGYKFESIECYVFP